jgi:hypothetical protein
LSKLGFATKLKMMIDSLMVYIERDVAAIISIYSIIDDFQDSKKGQIPF